MASKKKKIISPKDKSLTLSKYFKVYKLTPKIKLWAAWETPATQIKYIN